MEDKLIQLETIQKMAKLNTVYVHQDEDHKVGGAYHKYEIVRDDDTGEHIMSIQFQEGPRKEPGSTTGVLDVDLLEIVRNRLQGFQSGPFACEENQLALKSVEDALGYLNRRVENRLSRGVLGKNEK